MATSGTVAFALEFADCAEEAFERCGLRIRTGDDLRTARRSADVMLTEWQNHGVRLWTIEQASQALTASDLDYTLAADTLDVIEGVIRTGSGATQQDIPIERIGHLDYAAITNKNTTGKPLQYWPDRQQGAITLRFWPVPDAVVTYTFIYWRMRQIQDTGPGSANPDVPKRFLPAFIAGLTASIAEKRAPHLFDQKKALAQEAWLLATSNDTAVVSPIRIVPRMYC